MNMHVLHSCTARAEVRFVRACAAERASAQGIELMGVPKQMLSVKNGTPVIGLIQDAINGAYLGTQPGRLFERDKGVQLLFQCQSWLDLDGPRHLPPPSVWARRSAAEPLRPYYSACDLISAVLPPSLVFQRAPSSDDSPNGWWRQYGTNLLVINGQVRYGQWSASKTRDLLHRMHLDVNDQVRCQKAQDGLERLFVVMLQSINISVGMDELQNPCESETEALQEAVCFL